MGNGCPSKTMAPTRDNELTGNASNGRAFFSEQWRQSASECKAEGPFHFRLRDHIKWWEKHSNKEVLLLIKYGLMDSLPLPPKLSSKHCIRTRDETKLALETLQDYIQVGAVKDIKPSQARHLIPWFLIKKRENLRLITDCRGKNHYLEPKPFKLDDWQENSPF